MFTLLPKSVCINLQDHKIRILNNYEKNMTCFVRLRCKQHIGNSLHLAPLRSLVAQNSDRVSKFGR